MQYFYANYALLLSKPATTWSGKNIRLRMDAFVFIVLACGCFRTMFRAPVVFLMVFSDM